MFISNLHSSSELHEIHSLHLQSGRCCNPPENPPFPSQLPGHHIHVSIPASSHLDAAAAAISLILPVLSIPSGHSNVHFSISSHMEASALTVFSPLFKFQVEKHTGTPPYLIYSLVSCPFSLGPPHPFLSPRKTTPKSLP